MVHDLRLNALDTVIIDPQPQWNPVPTGGWADPIIIRGGVHPAWQNFPPVVAVASPLLCPPQQLVASKFPRVQLMKKRPSSLRNRRPKSPPRSHGPKSGYCLSSSSQSHSRLKSSTPSHQSYAPPFPAEFCFRFFLSSVHPLQFVRNVGITHGDESRVGYYVGMLVRLVIHGLICPPVSHGIELHSNLYSSSRRPSRSCTGAGSQISSAVNQSFLLDSSAYLYRCLALASQLLTGPLLCGTYPSLNIRCHPHPPLITYRRRGFNGALNGNVSVIKSIIAEITDPTNMPQVYAYVPIAWSFGGAIG